MIGPQGKVFRDPVHGLIRIEPDDEFILELINTPAFQRLRRIRQLGISSFTYPGAEHTRFAHSLGVFNFAQRILNVLQRRYAKEIEIPRLLDSQQRVVKAAALLHDVGHGPYSHLIERGFEEVADHEKKTAFLIQGGGAITQCLENHRISPKAVADLIRKTTEFRFLSDIVSSQLDADRMDYILRDALNTGVKYGAFDAEWVLNSLCLGGEPGLSGTPKLQDLRLCLDDRRGLYSAEQLVVARMHMSYQVYYHRATRGWESHLLCLLQLAADRARDEKLPKNTPSNVKEFLKSEGALQDDNWLWFDESAIEAGMHAWSGATEADPELAEMSRNFLLRKKTFHCVELPDVGIECALRLSKGLSAAGREGRNWLLDEPKFTSYKDFDSGFRTSKKRHDDAAISTNAILISDGNLSSASKPAELDSLVLNALGQQPQGSRTSLSRLFYHQNIAGPVEKMLAEIGVKSR